MYKWMASYSVGVPLFDEQHRALFALANALFAKLQTPPPSTKVTRAENASAEDAVIIEQLVQELVSYTQYHFSQEEKMMRLYHYPELEAHLQEHHEHIAFLESLDLEALKSNPYAVGRDLLDRLVIWITQHIQIVDKRYSHFLSNTRNTNQS